MDTYKIVLLAVIYNVRLNPHSLYNIEVPNIAFETNYSVFAEQNRGNLSYHCNIKYQTGVIAKNDGLINQG